MQHDTSPHRVVLSERAVTAQCAALTLAYSRRLFFQYSPRFTRFEAKYFLLEAVRFNDGSCPRCIIDNTSVVVVAGSGPEAAGDGSLCARVGLRPRRRVSRFSLFD